MRPSAETRDTIFKAFGRAFFRQDLDAMYAVVTPDFTWSVPDGAVTRVLQGREQIAAFFVERRGKIENVRFEDVVYHHAPDATFMTFRMTGTEVANGQSFERIGIERYTFRDGKLAVKDVYNRPTDPVG